MDLEQLLEKALSLADEGDWEAMASMLRDSLSEFEDQPAVHCWLGVAERELGMEGVAYERFKRAVALGSVDPYVLVTAGSGLAVFDDPDAETALRTAAITAPEVPVARLMYGAYLAREGFVKEGLDELEAARALDGDDAQIAFELGVARMLAGQADGAADSMGEAARLDPEDGWTRVALGLVLIEAGRIDEALAELNEGAHLAPEDVEAQLMAALAAAVIGSEGLAFEMLERARLRALEGDLALVTQVEDRLDEGPDEARAMLMDTMVPDSLRRRLQERP
jgi:tetratricopeptide (TPR) repeat protein